MPEIDIWYDWVDGDKLIGHLAPYGSDELGGGSERRARRRTGRGASTELTQVADGRRTIIENPPLRTHLQAVGDTDPEVISGGPADFLAAQPEQCQRAAPAESLGCDVIEKLASVLGCPDVGWVGD